MDRLKALEVIEKAVEARCRAISFSVQTGRRETKAARIEGVTEGGYAVYRALVAAGAFESPTTVVHYVDTYYFGEGWTACGLSHVPIGDDATGSLHADLTTCGKCLQEVRQIAATGRPSQAGSGEPSVRGLSPGRR